MGTKVGFWLFVLDSLKYSSKAESPINRSAKAVISRNLTTSRHNHLFNFSFIYSLFLCFIFIIYWFVINICYIFVIYLLHIYFYIFLFVTFICYFYLFAIIFFIMCVYIYLIDNRVIKNYYNWNSYISFGNQLNIFIKDYQKRIGKVSHHQLSDDVGIYLA